MSCYMALSKMTLFTVENKTRSFLLCEFLQISADIHTMSTYMYELVQGKRRKWLVNISIKAFVEALICQGDDDTAKKTAQTCANGFLQCLGPREGCWARQDQLLKAISNTSCETFQSVISTPYLGKDPFDAVLMIFPQSTLKNCRELEYAPIGAKFPPKIA